MSTMRTGTGEPAAARRAELTVPETDEPMWTDRMASAPRVGEGPVGVGELPRAGLRRGHLGRAVSKRA